MQNRNYKFRDIPVDKLRLDDFNPRLPKSFQGQSEQSIIEYMLLEASTLELMQSIGENGFFPGEQLLVVEQSDGNYLVVEGNRRLTAVKLLTAENLATVQKKKVHQVYEEAKFRPNEIPCLVFDDKETILKYLGFRHITGTKPWKLLEKGRYLFELRNTDFSKLLFSEAARELAKVIGSRSDYVKRLLLGYAIYQLIEDRKYFNIKDLDDTQFYLNYIVDSLRRDNISNFLGIKIEDNEPLATVDLANLEKWTKWLFEKNDQGKTRMIGDSYDLNKLDKILGNEDARIAFDEKKVTLKRAYERTEDIDQLFQDSVLKSLNHLETGDSLVHKVKKFYPNLIENLQSIRLLTKKIKDVKDGLKDDF
ncbi:MAG: ParB N-terminal domain-containing protein [Ekhidna sp.]|nr:ParB N-terminal domain-containing protein [Ekhidna sp.]